MDDEYDVFEDEVEAPRRQIKPSATAPTRAIPEERTEGQLPVDMYQTADEIVIRTFVAGVRPEEVNVSISRDMVVIDGSREERTETSGTDFFSQELFWGTFSRTIMLPQEIEIDSAEAVEKHGLLIIRLPKVDKSRQTKWKVTVM